MTTPSDRVAAEAQGDFYLLPDTTKQWYRQVALARAQFRKTGDSTDLVALGAWLTDEEELDLELDELVSEVIKE